MKTKIFKFPDGKIAVSKGMRIMVNRKQPILEEEIDIDGKGFGKLLTNPQKFKFSKNSKKLEKKDYLSKHSL